MLYTPLVLGGTHGSFFWRYVIFSSSISLSQDLAAGIRLWSLVYGECVFPGTEWGSCQCALLYQAETSMCLHKLTAPERKLLRCIWFFFFSKQRHAEASIRRQGKCCYASLNKLVFKQSFLWFTADGGMWLMLPFKTLVLLVVSQPSPLFPGWHIISMFHVKWRILDGLL